MKKQYEIKGTHKPRTEDSFAKAANSLITEAIEVLKDIVKNDNIRKYVFLFTDEEVYSPELETQVLPYISIKNPVSSKELARIFVFGVLSHVSKTLQEDFLKYYSLAEPIAKDYDPDFLPGSYVSCGRFIFSEDGGTYTYISQDALDEMYEENNQGYQQHSNQYTDYSTEDVAYDDGDTLPF